jgi:hypothetical protein
VGARKVDHVEHIERVSGRPRTAAAGAVAAAVWALQEPLDQWVTRCDYSDVALLGKAVVRGPHWRSAGFAIHLVNGAIFGLAFHELRQRLRLDSTRLALGMALAEHVTLYPLAYFVDRYHPARGERGVPPLLRNRRAFAQATWRHTVFGFVLACTAAPSTRNPRRSSGRAGWLVKRRRLRPASSVTGRKR